MSLHGINVRVYILSLAVVASYSPRLITPTVVPSHFLPPAVLKLNLSIRLSVISSRTIPSNTRWDKLFRASGASASVIRFVRESAPPCCDKALPSRSHRAIHSYRAVFLLSRLVPIFSCSISSLRSTSSPVFKSRTNLRTCLFHPVRLNNRPVKAPITLIFMFSSLHWRLNFSSTYTTQKHNAHRLQGQRYPE